MKYAPISIRRFSLEVLVGQEVLLDLLEPVQEEVAGSLMAAVELAHHVVEQARRLPAPESDMTRAMIRSIRCSLVGSNGRITTRLLLGLRTMPVRRTFNR